MRRFQSALHHSVKIAHKSIGRNRIVVQREGFSLLEVMLVLFIVASATTIVSLRFSGSLRKARVDATLSQWKLIELYVRRLNLSGDLTLEITSSPSGQIIQIFGAGNQDPLKSWFIASPVKVQLSTLSLEPIRNLTYARSYGCTDYIVSVRDGSFIRSEMIAGASGQGLQLGKANNP